MSKKAAGEEGGAGRCQVPLAVLHTAIASRAVRFLITRVEPTSLIKSFFFSSLNKRRHCLARRANPLRRFLVRNRGLGSRKNGGRARTVLWSSDGFAGCRVPYNEPSP